MQRDLVVLGIDLGPTTVGNGIVNCDEKTKLTMIDYGTILTEVGEQFPVRLNQIKHGITQLTDIYKSDSATFEELFF